MVRLNGHHIYLGKCPDLTDPYTRDERCPVCQALMFMEKRLTKRAADQRKAAAQKRSVNKNLVGGRAVR
jgi:hypothetical protein